METEGGTIRITSYFHDACYEPVEQYEELDRFKPLHAGFTVSDMGKEWIEIVIEDDGAGFDMEQELAGKNVDIQLDHTELRYREISGADKIHVGIQNVRKRLQMMCGGDLLIISAKDKGTVAIIRLPVGNIEKEV